MVTNFITGKSYTERYASPNWPSDFLRALITFSRKYILRFSTPLGRLSRTSLSSHTNEGNTFRESSSANGCPAITWIRWEMLIMWLVKSRNLQIGFFFSFYRIAKKILRSLRLSRGFVFCAYLLVHIDISIVSPAQYCCVLENLLPQGRKLGMRKLTESLMLSVFKAELTRAARFLTAGQGDRRLRYEVVF